MNHSTLIKLAEFEALEQGWCYGEGVPIKKSILKYAEQIFYSLFEQGISKTDAFPGLNGEVRVTGYEDEHYLEFTIEGDGNITYLYELNDQEQIYLEGLSLSAAIKKTRKTISDIKPCQRLLDRYTKDIGIKISSVFKVWHSNRPVTAEFLSSAENAPYRRVTASVHTQQDSIKKLPMTHQFTGYSSNQSSPAIIKSFKPQVIQEIHAIGM